MLAKLVDPDVARALRGAVPGDRRGAPRGPPVPRRARSPPTSSAPPPGTPTTRKLTGRIGLESSQDNLLAGSDGLRVVDTAEGSNAVIPGSTRFERPAAQGSHLQLTLDSDLQYTVQRALVDYVAQTGAKADRVGGGARRAHRRGAARWPTARRSTRATSPARPRRAARQPGGAEPVRARARSTRSSRWPRRWSTASRTPGRRARRCRAASGSPTAPSATPGTHGTEHYTLTGVLAKSSNVGTIMTAQKVGEERFADMLGAVRARPRDRRRAAGREPGLRAAARAVVRLDVRQPADRAGPVDDRAADGRDVPGGRQQRAAHPAADRRVDHRPGRRARRAAARRPACRWCRPQTAATLRTMLTAVTQDARGQRGTGPRPRCPATRWRARPAPRSRSTRRAAATRRRRTGSPSPGCCPAQDPRYVIGIMLDAPGGRHQRGAAVPRHRHLPGPARPAPGQRRPAAGRRPCSCPDPMPSPTATHAWRASPCRTASTSRVVAGGARCGRVRRASGAPPVAFRAVSPPVPLRRRPGAQPAAAPRGRTRSRPGRSRARPRVRSPRPT